MAYTHGKAGKATHGTGSTLANLCISTWGFNSVSDTDDVTTMCDEGFGAVIAGVRRGRVTMQMFVDADSGPTIEDGDTLADVSLLYHKDKTAGWAIDEVLITNVNETTAVTGKITLDIEGMTNGSYERVA